MLKRLLFCRKHPLLFAECLLWLIVGFFCFSLTTNAQTPDPALWGTDATVYSIVQHGNYTYIGGDFQFVGPRPGNGVKLTTSSGAFNADFAKVSGTVYCSAADGSGGWYIGGDFTQVGNQSRNRIAHILNNGSVDINWNPDADGIVRSIAVSGSDIYAGGLFTNIGGLARNRIAKLNNTTGAANAAWNPNANNAVYCIAISGSDIYAGGLFTNIGGLVRNRIAKLNNTTGTADATWNPSAAGGTPAVYTIVFNGSTIYVGGTFNSIGGVTRFNIARLNNTTGVADATWNPNSSAAVYGIGIIGSDIYVGGYFNSIGGIARACLAKLNNTTGTADATWNPAAGGASSTTMVLALGVSGSDIYVGGNFKTLGGYSRNHIAKLNNTTGAFDAAWNPNANDQVRSITLSGSDIYAGGSFTILGGLARSRIARINTATGAADATWNPNANEQVRSIAVSGGNVYAAGGFTNIGGLSRNRIAKLDTVTGTATTWNPNANDEVRTIAINGTDIYAGGVFTNVGGQTRNRIAKLSSSANTADANWNPGCDGEVRTFAISGTDIYVGGSFSTIGGVSRNNIAKLSTASGAAVNTTWDANCDNGVFGMAISGSDIYVAGHYGGIGGASRASLARVNNATGTADSWDPNVHDETDVVAVYGTDVYVGGYFNAIGPQNVNSVAKLSSVTGLVDVAWMPEPDQPVKCIIFIGSHIYLGGEFNTINGVYKPCFARFTAPVTWTGNVSNDWNIAGNWSGNAVPAATDAVIIPSGTTNAPDLNNASYTVKDLTQTAGQTIVLGTGTITVSDALMNNGTITGTGKVLLNGNARQYITGTGTVSNLELNNSNGAIIGNTASDSLKITGLLTLTSGTLITNDKLVLKSTNAITTAMVGPMPRSGAGISGNLIHERYLSAPANGSNGRSWRLLTSPLANNATDNSIFYHWQNNGVNNGTGLELFGPSGTGAAGNGLEQGGVNPSIRSFDYLTNTYIPVTNTKTTMLFNGTRNNTFMAFVSGSYGSGNINAGSGATNAVAAGTLITGTQNYSFTTPNATNTYYLMGNPYACPIDFDKVYNNTGTVNINRKFWVIDPNLSNAGAYTTVTYTGSTYVTSTGSQNQYIQTGQGFFIEGTTPTVLSTVAIEENNKETGAAQTAMFRTNGGSLETLRIKLYKDINSTNTLLDGAVVAGHQTNNNAIDGVDGLKFDNFDENIGIFTSGKVLAIDARQLLDNNDTVSVSLSSMQQTVYQLEIEPGNMGASSLTATLIDNFTNTLTPVSLTANTTYSFTVTANAASTGTNRFRIVFNAITPLPLQFVNANAIKNGDKVDLQWTAGNQDDIRTYEVERSADASSFTKITTITVSPDNSYNYADEAPLNGSNYYRIKAIARSSNKGVYSYIMRVNMNGKNAGLNAYPNPVKGGHLQISVTNFRKGNYIISIYNAAGQKAAAKQLSHEAGSTLIDIDITSFSNGIYLVHLTNENGEIIAEQKVVKQ